MKYLILITILFGTKTTELFGQNWLSQILTEQVSIDFPSEPVLSDTLGIKTFSYSDADASYLMNIRDLGKLKNFQLKENELENFYNKIIEGTIQGSQGELISKSQFTMSGFKGIEIEYTSSVNPDLPNLRFKRIILLNTTIYLYDFWTVLENKEQTHTDRDKYFNSFTIIGDTATIKQYTITDN